MAASKLMAWIEVHQALPTHRKTLALADSLKIEPVVAVGHLCCLWMWALDNAPDGKLGGVAPGIIARAAQWKRAAEPFVSALVSAGFIDQTADAALIHDWPDYAGRLLERRQRDAARKRAERNHEPDVPPPSNGRPPDNHRMSDASRAHITVPNPTVPNQTIPETTPNGVDVEIAEPSPGDDRVDEVYGHFKARVQPRSRLCPRKKIAARLKRFSAAELNEGIDHFADDPWWMENNGGRGAEWFFESDARAEQFLLMKPRPAANVVPLNGGQKRPIDAPPSVPADSPFLKYREVG